MDGQTCILDVFKCFVCFKLSVAIIYDLCAGVATLSIILSYAAVHSVPLECTFHQGLQLQGTTRILFIQNRNTSQTEQLCGFYKLVSYYFMLHHFASSCLILFHAYCFILCYLGS